MALRDSALSLMKMTLGAPCDMRTFLSRSSASVGSRNVVRQSPHIGSLLDARVNLDKSHFVRIGNLMHLNSSPVPPLEPSFPMSGDWRVGK